MYGCDHSIGCLSVFANRIGNDLSVSAFRVGYEDGKGEFRVSAKRIGGELKVTCGIVCSINADFYIRFKDDKVVWYGNDNNEGIVKYNTLIASGDWSLEEVEIEELL